MTRATLFERFKLAILESGDTTAILITKLDSIYNANIHEFYSHPSVSARLTSHFSMAKHSITLSLPTRLYSFKRAAKITSTGTGMTVANASSITTLTHSTADFSSVGVGDILVMASVDYPVVEGGTTTLKLLDAGAAITAATAYTVICNPFAIFGMNIDDGSGYPVNVKLTNKQYEAGDRGYNMARVNYLRLVGNNVELRPENNSLTGTLTLYYLPSPPEMSAYLLSLSNPTGLSDQFNNALAVYLASKYWLYRPEPNTKLAAVMMQSAMAKLDNSGMVSFGV